MNCAIGFVADAMLGKLARWLRILGYDTLYDPDAEDRQLIELAAATGRVLLTADRELMRHRRAEKLFISSKTWREQLREVARAYPPPPHGLFSRCLECNRVLEPVERGTVRERIPAYLYQGSYTFVRCPGCGKVYWRGTHVERVRAQLREIFDPEPERSEVESSLVDEGRSHDSLPKEKQRKEREEDRGVNARDSRG